MSFTVPDIYNYIVCNGPFSWYDHAGRIVVDKLKAVLKNDKHKVGTVSDML